MLIKNGLKSIIYFVLGLMLLWAPPIFAAQKPSKLAIILDVTGPITPASQDYIERGIDQATKRGASLVILRIDTPGGLDKSMRGIIKKIRSSPIPIVSYVAPSGSRAASAGTYILYASHIAAMAPGTNLGAATPVRIGGGGGLPSPTPTDKDKKQDGKSKPTGKTAMEKKIINDAVAYIRSLADLHGRNADWAEQAVREGKSLQASKALKMHVIDLMAENIPDLLSKINGRTVTIQGQKIVLNTKGLTLDQIKPDWRNRFLAVITNPNVAYILLMIGIYGLIFEFANPGFVLPGVVGGICLLIAFYALQLLPISYAGLALIILGIAFMVAEAMMPSFGVLGMGGIVAFVIGSVLLLDTGVEGYSIDWTLILIFSAISAAFFLIVIGMVIKARRRPIVTGEEELIDLISVAETDIDENSGAIRIHSERWQARSKQPIVAGTKVKVTKVYGLIANVEPVEKS